MTDPTLSPAVMRLFEVYELEGPAGLVEAARVLLDEAGRAGMERECALLQRVIDGAEKTGKWFTGGLPQTID